MEKHEESHAHHNEAHQHHEHRAAEHAHHEEHKSSNPNMKLWIMAIVLGLLVILSGVQAVELVSLKNKLGKEITALGSSKSSVSTSSGSLTDNVKNLPSMVGGC